MSLCSVLLGPIFCTRLC